MARDTTQSKRELAAEVACLLAFSAIRNNDKVGLILFTDRVELFIPPKKGRSHTLRLIREVLFFEPAGRGTNAALALDYLNKIVTRRAVVFFISDFQAPDFSHPLAVSGRRHDLIAVHIQDEREQVLPNVGIITLEDAETDEQIEINTADRGTRARFSDLADEEANQLSRTLRRNNIDLFCGLASCRISKSLASSEGTWRPLESVTTASTWTRLTVMRIAVSEAS